MTTRSASQPLVIERRWTAAEYRRLPEGPPYYELEDGELIEMVAPRGKHQRIIKRLCAVIDEYLRENPIGDIWPTIAVELSSTRIYIPDLTFLLTEHFDRFADDISVKGPPDLVVEVLSPSTASRDKTQKLWAYLRAGVLWYWLIETESLLITEYRHTSEGYLVHQITPPNEPFTPALFPGLSLRMAEMAGAPSVEEESHE